MSGLKRLIDLMVTLIVWIYFTIGYLLFFSPIHLFCFFFSTDRPRAFQTVNSFFYRGFFRLLRGLSMGVTMDIQDEVRAIRGAVVVSNHISYFDPLLFISLFRRHKTIVKGIFFKVPIFGWVLRCAGYIPSSGGGGISTWMVDHMKELQDHLASGGNLFVFPEGTRSRDGRIGKMHHGAFRIARGYGVPFVVLRISGTNGVLPPGRFVFHTCSDSVISVKVMGELQTGTRGDGLPISEMAGQVRALLDSP
ncbi:MAG: lysophospholipid acyltransferase family protein [Deltaproteobacteria bacterium]|nr:lysophospholipid acyltransferase family protein [Deltaproteobacteria bacterium]